MGSFWRLLKSLWSMITGKADDAADKIDFSVEGEKRLFREAAKAKSEQFDQLKTSVGQLQGVINGDIAARDKKAEELDKVEDALHGVMAAADKAEQNGGKLELDGKVWTVDELNERGNKFLQQKEKVEGEKAKLDKAIKTGESQVKQFKKQLETLLDEIKSLPAEEAETISEHISDDAKEQIFNQINGIITSATKEDPLAKLRANRQKRHGKAEVTSDMAGLAINNDTDTFASLGKDTKGTSKFEEMRAARKAERDAQTGGTKTTTPTVTTGTGTTTDGGRPELK
jgi:hypothetical protein